MRVQGSCGNGIEGMNSMLFNRTGIKFCPKCRSTRLEVRYLDPFSLQPKYYCRKCGFSGFLVPELEREGDN
jgi:predicted nucleic-acid-binding Zn-ribbon protein